MTTHPTIFVTLPVADITASRTFWSTLGYSINEQLSDDTALCVAFSDSIFAMMLRRDRFETFTDKPVADASSTTQVLIGLTTPTRADVDTLVDAAVAAGGTELHLPEVSMEVRAFSDLDGHGWEIMWTAPRTVEPAAETGEPGSEPA